MAKIMVITDDDGKKYTVMRYADYEAMKRERALLLGLSDDEPPAAAEVYRIECTEEQWADLQEWIGPLDEESGPASNTAST